MKQLLTKRGIIMKLNKISPLIFALFFYFLAITINLLFDIISINYSTSSTASIGYIFAPIDALISSGVNTLLDRTVDCKLIPPLSFFIIS